jgi:hypothetical protein
MKSLSVSDVLGPWKDPDFNSGLIERCKNNWCVPVSDLTNQVLATYLRQDIAVEIMIPEARKRVEVGIDDDSELYDGELSEALAGALRIEKQV